MTVFFVKRLIYGNVDSKEEIKKEISDETKGESESKKESENENESEKESENENESESEKESESENESESEKESESENENKNESENESESESESTKENENDDNYKICNRDCSTFQTEFYKDFRKVFVTPEFKLCSRLYLGFVLLSITSALYNVCSSFNHCIDNTSTVYLPFCDSRNDIQEGSCTFRHPAYIVYYK
jgi:DNA mismatch repair ATPase MutL